MRRTAALVTATVLLVLAAGWVLPGRAYACGCTTDSEPELFRNAQVIFTGTVSQQRALGDTRTYTFAVDRVYRGQALTSQSVSTPAQAPACGLELDGAGPYLVLGYVENGKLLANSCGGTRPGAAPADLGPGYPPQAGAAPTGFTWTPTSGGATLVLGAAFLGIAVFLAGRRRT